MMLNNEKWLKYSILTLKAVSKGASSISEVAYTIGQPESYIAKVVASLRSGGFIDKEYQLPKQLSQITLCDLLSIQYDELPTEPIAKYIVELIINDLKKVTIEQVIKDTDEIAKV